MRITLVNKFLQERGGDTTSVRLLRAWLERLGHEVSLFGTRPLPRAGEAGGPAPSPGDEPGSEPPELPDADLFPEPLPTDGFGAGRIAALYRPSAGAALGKLIERRRPDLVHLHNIHYHLGGAVLAEARARRLPVVWTLHDVNLFCPNISGCRDGRPCLECHVARFHRCVRFNCRGSGAASLAAAAEAYLFRALGLWREVSCFIAPSRFTGLLLELHGVPPPRIAHLEPALDLERFAAPQEGGGGFLYVGRLAREKGVEVLVRAVGRLPGARLAVAGEGPERPALERLAGQLAPGRVRFLGHLSRRQVAGALARCDALVLPSVCMEVAPLALLEAAAAARPAVASRVGGVPEWVEEGATGLLVPPGESEPLAEALSTLAASPERASRMGSEARQRALGRHDPERHCSALERIYASAAAA